MATLVENLEAGGILPVRLSTAEGLDFGDRALNYIHMVAELVVRLCSWLLRHGQGPVSLWLTCAEVYLGDDVQRGTMHLREEDYLRALRERQALISVQGGLALEAIGWQVESLRLGYARHWPELRICDLLSNASYRDYGKPGTSAGLQLRAAFGDRDFGLVPGGWLEQADGLASHGSYGLALRLLCEELLGDRLSAAGQRTARDRIDSILRSLGRQPAPLRDLQLQGILDWVSELVDGRLSLALGHRACRELGGLVADPLRAQLVRQDDGSLAWFQYALNLRRLIVCNHLGLLREARASSNALDRLAPQLARRWEQAPLLLEGMICQAVHLTDCLECDEAVRRVKLVSDYYESLSGLFHLALPDIFPRVVCSTVRARALGTWVQALMVRMSTGLADLEQARQLNDGAIAEFAEASEKARQYQYRCQLETRAHQFAQARAYLARSLELPSDSHASLGLAIAALPEAFQGFPLLHWLRLGCSAVLAGDRVEGEAFEEAFRRSRLAHCAWCRGEAKGAEGPVDYPVHGILRRIAVLHASAGERDAALSTLRSVGRLVSDAPRVSPLEWVEFAACAEVAGLLWQNHQKHARRLLVDAVHHKLGLVDRLQEAQLNYEKGFPDLCERAGAWWAAIQSSVDCPRDNEALRANLLGLASSVDA